MKFIKQDLLTLLIGLFLFSACKSTNSIGIEPEPGYAIDGDLADSSTVLLTTVQDDPAGTIGLTGYPLGWINADPVFGTTEAEIAMSLALPSNNYSFGRSPLVDSAVLILPYVSPVDSSRTSHFYGDTTSSVFNFEVRQLKEDLALQKAFMSNKEWETNDPAVGTFTGKLRPNTKFKVIDIVKGAADTARVVSTPQLRIRLDNDFIQQNIVNLDSAAYMTRSSKFMGSFKGLKVSLNRNGSSGPGAIAFFNFTSTDELARANVAIYYTKLQDNSQIIRDTATVYFPISSSSGPIAATVKHDYTGTPVRAQLDVPDPATPYPVTYLQAMGGLRNKISFPNLVRFAENVTSSKPGSRIVINKAELVVNVSSGTDVQPFTPAERLSLYRLDIAGQRTNLIDNVTPSPGSTNPWNTGAFGGFYDRTNKRYIFIITGYLQQLIDGTTKDYGTYLAPSLLSQFSLTPSISSAEQTVINTQAAGSGNKGIKLNIYYTLADQK